MTTSVSALTKEIGDRLRQARKAAGYKSARVFVSQYNIPESTYSQHELGKRALTADLILFYGQCFGVSPNWLLLGEESNVLGGVQLPHHRLVIEGKQATIDVGLFREVLGYVMPLVREAQETMGDDEMIEFAIEIYNGVVMISGSEEDRRRMMQLSVASLQRGIRDVVVQEDEGRKSA